MNTNTNATRILCFGDSNTWGWVPGKMGSERFSVNERWPAIMQTMLGDDYEIIEEGLGGRATAYDDPRPEMPLRNGLTILPILLEAHSPLDIVILTLGTTDTKEIMNLTAEQIRDGMEKLILAVQNFKLINNKKIKHVLVAAPSIVKEDAEFASKLFKGGTEKGKQLVPLYEQLAGKYGCSFIDTNQFAKVDEIEGVHLTLEGHQSLGKAMTEKIKEMLN